MKQNSFKTVFVSAKTAVKRFSQSQAVISRLCKTAVFDAISQTLVNKHGDHMRY